LMEKEPQDSAGSSAGYPSRRTVLKGAAALSGSALFPAAQLLAQTQAGSARAIDCHHHFGSPAYAKTIATHSHHVTGFSVGSESITNHWKDYSPAKVVEFLDKQDVATAVLSCTTPGIWFGDPDETRGLARDMNEFGAKMVSDYKGRFGLFALLPLPSLDDSLREIEYAFDTLHADGVCIFTSYERHWLGSPIFRPVFDELNRRKAVVFVHPYAAFEDLMPGVNTSTLEFLTDTMRTMYSLLAMGAATRYGDVRFIFSHAGGSMPSLIERFGVGRPGTIDDVLARPAEPNSNLFRLRRFYYDAANSCNTVQLQGLKTIVGASQIVFGSDSPIIESPGRQLQGLQTCGFNAQELVGIHRGNAQRLFPRLSEKT
jgi:predicted TIM-barrel fold metal-dependent hydrolase